jgi:hypothetical protein
VAKYPESPTTIGLWGCKVTEHLKNRRDGLIARIDALLKEVSILEQQLAAFDIILKDYDENYRPAVLSGRARESLQRFLQARSRRCSRMSTSAELSCAS